MKLVINKTYDNRTVLDYLRNELKLSRGIITALKKKERGIMLNDEHVTVRAVLKSGDCLELELEDAGGDENENILPADIPVEIVYEDEDIVAVNKPSGMPTHPSQGHHQDSLANAMAYFYKKQGIPFVFRAVNRLDRDTSGIVLIAKNRPSAYKLSKQLTEGNIHKQYTSIVEGRLSGSGEISKNIRRKSESVIEREVCPAGTGKAACTKYDAVASDGILTLVNIMPETGRTHQIRVHFASIGHPVCGDTLYGQKEGSPYINRQALHCSSLTFMHPVKGGGITVHAELQDDMKILTERITG